MTASADLDTHCSTSDFSAVTSEILAPISLGELVDKITILQIKSRQLAGAALENVKRELSVLERVLAGLELAVDPSLMQQLEAINANLWAIEDAIRDHERRRLFDDAFVQLARSVYRNNDERAAIKRQINDIYGSALVEEKSYQVY